MSVTIVTTDEIREGRWCPQFRLKLNKRAFVQNAFTVNSQIISILQLTKTIRTQLKAKTLVSHDVPERSLVVPDINYVVIN